MGTYDFSIQNHGSIVILTPTTPAAHDWVDKSLDPNAQRWGTGYAVEPRYLGNIMHGFMADGLTAYIAGKVLAGNGCEIWEVK